MTTKACAKRADGCIFRINKGKKIKKDVDKGGWMWYYFKAVAENGSRNGP